MQIEEFSNYPLKGQPYYQEGRAWVSPFNFLPETTVNVPKSIRIHDVTLRDGEQTPGNFYTIDDRIRIATALDELGVSSIEAGMPIISHDTAEGIRAMVNLNLNADVVGFCRAKKEDIDKCLEVGIKTIILEHSVNPYICKYAYKLDEAQVHERIIGGLRYAKECGMTVRFMGWDSFRSSESFLKNLYEDLAANGIDGIVIVDTFAIATPMAVEYLFSKAKSWVPNTELEFHVHNDMSMANASALAAVRAGASCVHSAINALGDRTGNLATEELATAFELLLGIDTGINLEKIASTCKMVSDLTRYPIAPNKPITGKNAFAVEAGAVADFMVKMEAAGEKLCTLPYMPPVVGRDFDPYLLGSSSGTASLRYYFDKFNIEATPEQTTEILMKVKKDSSMSKLCLTEKEFLAIVDKVLSK